MPFAGLRGHDPDGNQYDLSQKGMANVREGYVEFGWEQPRWINHICIRSGRPAHIAEFYQKVFDLQPVEGMSGDNSYYLTDGKVRLGDPSMGHDPIPRATWRAWITSVSRSTI